MPGQNKIPARVMNLEAHSWDHLLGALDPTACIFLAAMNLASLVKRKEVTQKTLTMTI